MSDREELIRIVKEHPGISDQIIFLLLGVIKQRFPDRSIMESVA